MPAPAAPAVTIAMGMVAAATEQDQACACSAAARRAAVAAKPPSARPLARRGRSGTNCAMPTPRPVSGALGLISDTRFVPNSVEEINALRRRLGIKVKGQAVPEPVATFDCDGFAGTMTSKRLRRTLLANIEASGAARGLCVMHLHHPFGTSLTPPSAAYKEPTAVQMQALPALLSGRDVLACAPTGSGKTAAFLLPVLARLANNRPPRVAGELRRIHALVLAPTHELAQQTLREFDRLSAGMGIKAALLTKATAAGAGANAAALDVAEAGEASDSDSGSGSSSESDGEASQKRRAPRSRACLPFVDVLISTPLRLASMIEESDATTRQLADVQMVILDEADKLLEMGFVEQADTVLAACTNDKIVRGMFSATMASGIEELAHTALRDAVQVVVGKVGAGASDIDQKLLYVGREEGKLMAIRQQIREGMRPPVLIFLQSKERANELYSELKYDGVKAGILHGDMPLAAREDMVRRYRIGEVWFLIATDLIGRGLDFKGINTVINYDFPQTAVSYVHRIGRTGRAGRRGTAITYFTEDDVPRLRAIANVMRLSGCDVPAWMLSIKKLGRNAKRNLERYAPKRRPISTVAKYDRRKAAKKRRAVAASKAKKEKAHGSTTAAAASNGS